MSLQITTGCRIIILIIFLIGCGPKTTILSVREFRDQYLDSLAKEFPKAVFKKVGDSTIESQFQDNDIRISVDNAYREYQANRDSLTKVLTRYVSAISEVFTPR